LPFIAQTNAYLIWAVFSGVFACFFIIQPNWNIIASHKYRLNIIALVPNGQAHIWLSIGIGYFLGWLLWFIGLSDFWLTQALVALLCVFAVFHTTIDLQDMQRLAFQDDDPGPNESATAHNGGRLHRFFGYCNNVAHQYKLTPRESEVLVLLAKGRNAGYIASTLVLSNHTVKTHIYHIYQKLDINSQQELIDKVDKAMQQAD
ncbi:MAG: helix-turn-helix transcriptional regulator, partial [Coriobacteriales bacterium]|nr:helix-turn-helix transcriptional regulator [Coriobacteriales bacterium]